MIELNEAGQAARSYAAAMDSVTLINGGKPEGASEADWEDTLKRNKEHLRIQLAKPEFCKGFDMAPLQNASE